ncbi:Branched-chain amino acid transport system / permease component [Neomoorella glycerini]|uniref:Branched-chain amino acid transport system / permease component n=1 Tax=Neomoorella glycerini TaxID=55779 RepID=A0A6I5ZW01_9FIRM|nr:ABC transporter permease [Moorella glycerini]QGP93637.1 Branched-chain amino acid transport system / permease component [Moorella glycerini]
MTKSRPGLWLQVLPSLLAVAAALLVGALIILAIGENPVAAYAAMVKGAFGSVAAWADTLQRATPYILGALAFLIAAKAGLFNIGIEGQMYMGGMVAAIIGFSIPHLPAVLHLSLALLGAMLAGLVWSLIPGWLKVKSGVHEVISTIMLNYVAYAATGYLTVHVFHEPGVVAQTFKIKPAAILPCLLPPSRLNAGFLLALVIALVLWIFLFYTPWGYNLRVTGLSLPAARYAGIRSRQVIFGAMLASGAIGGLMGAERILGVYERFIHAFSPGYGFTAIAVALLGQNHPLGIIPAAILFGALESGSSSMSLQVNVPRELGMMLQAVIIVFVAAQAFIKYWLSGPARRGGRSDQ